MTYLSYERLANITFACRIYISILVRVVLLSMLKLDNFMLLSSIVLLKIDLFIELLLQMNTWIQF